MDKNKLFLLLLILILVIFAAYTTTKTLEKQPGEAVPAGSAEISESKPKDIQLASPDGKQMAFIMGGQGFLIGPDQDFAKADRINVGIKDLDSLSWSPDSRFVFAGSTRNSFGVIIDTRDLTPGFFNLEKTEVNGYASGPFWDPEGKRACFTVKSRLWQNDREKETTDLAVITMKSRLGSVRLARGNLQYYLEVTGWDNDGQIKYSKVSRKDNQVLEQLSTEYAHHIFSLDIAAGEKKELARIKPLEYQYFQPSPDHKWLSMVRYTFSAGESAGGIPCFYNIENGKIIDLKEEYNTWDWEAKWFSDSSGILFAQTTIYSLEAGKRFSYTLPKDTPVLGGEPSPDGSKVAFFACQAAPEPGSKGEPLILYIVDSHNKNIIKTIRTSLYPLIGKLGDPEPIRLAWTKDNRNLLVESWGMRDYAYPSLWKISLADESVHKMADSGQYPIVSPDGQKVISFFHVYSDQEINRDTVLSIHSSEGTLIAKLSLKESGFYGFAGTILWNDTSDMVMATADKYEEGVLEKYIVCWDFQGNRIKEIRVEPSVNPLYVQDNRIICIDGSIHL